mmetsp:Transcript_20223/g.56018  ORF Transcript_20223/g.56018 Transcript_20223/m.56018 type:complete len:108 (-) Transcript_20223:942-1265(-)
MTTLSLQTLLQCIRMDFLSMKVPETFWLYRSRICWSNPLRLLPVLQIQRDMIDGVPSFLMIHTFKYPVMIPMHLTRLFAIPRIAVTNQSTSQPTCQLDPNLSMIIIR